MSEEQATFENALNMAISGDNLEKTRYDKLLGKEDAVKLRDLMKKKLPTIHDIDESMNVCVSLIPKLSRLNEKERKLLGLYYLRIDKYSKRVKRALEVYNILEQQGKKTEIREQIIEEYLGRHRLNVNAYLYAMNSALSIEGNMIDSLTTDSKDIQYNYPPGLMPPQGTQKW
jgi:hypothetical protein